MLLSVSSTSSNRDFLNCLGVASRISVVVKAAVLAFFAFYKSPLLLAQCLGQVVIVRIVLAVRPGG